MKPYNWHEAITNGLLAFLACLGAKFPALAACVVSATACDAMAMPSMMELKHALITCSSVLGAVEVRYVWRYLKQFEDYPEDLRMIKK